jgi:hypothetical protein
MDFCVGPIRAWSDVHFVGESYVFILCIYNIIDYYYYYYYYCIIITIVTVIITTSPLGHTILLKYRL